MRTENKGAGERKRKLGKDLQPDPPQPKRYNLRFKDANDVRRLLSATLNDLRRGGIDVQVARALIYGGQVLLNVFEQCELGERVKRLEALTQYGGQQ